MQLAMFPLGCVLFPAMVLPLHVFEDRYRVMTRRCLDGDQEFGVVLIERGSEVGGHDVRSSVGTVARILEAVELPDGRFVLGTVGTRRIRVVRWLEDDPYPRAEVEDWDDAHDGGDLADRYEAAKARLRRVLARTIELGEAAVEATVELAGDPLLGSYQLAAVAPLGPHDQQRALAAEGAAARLALLEELLAGEEAFLERRLQLG